MKETRTEVFIAIFAWVPYVLVSWVYAKASGGSFGAALGVLLAMRLFFIIIESLGGLLTWRLYGRAKMIERNLYLLRSNNFPMRQHDHDDFLNYLGRIELDDSSPQELKMAAKQWEQILGLIESSGILVGMRMHAAADEALNIYSPKQQTPDLGTTRA